MMDVKASRNLKGKVYSREKIGTIRVCTRARPVRHAPPPVEYTLRTDECLHGQHQSPGFCQLFSRMSAHLRSKDGAMWVTLDF